MFKSLLISVTVITGWDFVFTPIDRYIPFAENKLVSRVEVSNRDYKTFLKAVKDSVAYSKSWEIQNNNWLSQPFSFFTPYAQLYHSATQYDLYPVVNISYEGVLAYCEWLTRKYNLDPERNFNQVKFRLPAPSEFQTISKKFSHHIALYDQELQGNDSIIKQEIHRDMKSGFFVTRPVHVTALEDQEILQLYGNVSEMTSEKGIAFGKNWSTPQTEDLGILSDTVHYSGASPFVGIRLVMEIVKR